MAKNKNNKKNEGNNFNLRAENPTTESRQAKKKQQNDIQQRNQQNFQ